MMSTTHAPRISARRLAVLALIGLGTGPILAEVAPRTPTGQTLAVPDADFERGQVFYILPGEDTQLALTSTAPLKRTILTTSRAVGYVVGAFDPEESAKPVLGGALRVPVAALASGSPDTDLLVQSADYLDLASHPEMTFELTGISEVETLPGGSKDAVAFRLQLLGKLSARGVARDVVMPAEVRFLLTTFDTFARAAGDLITIQGSFEVELADFGWKMPDGAAGLVAPRLAVDVFLAGSTLSPENHLDPNLDVERWRAERRYLTLARDLDDAQAAATYGDAYLAKYRDDAAALDGLARLILDEPGLRRRDLALARRLVARAQELDAESAELGETRAKLTAARGE